MGPPPGDETQLTQTSFDGSLGDDEPVAGLTVLWHADPSRVGARRPLPLLAAGRPVQVSRTQPTFATRDGIEVPLDDRSISRQPMTLRPIDRSGAIALELGDSRTRVQADGEAIGGRRVFDGASIERGVVLQLGRRTLLLLHRQPVRQPPTGPDFGLVGQSAGLTRLRDEISRLADLDLPILVRGATGTGKELVARALHDAGRRRDRPFVAVNMATVSPTLAAAELFGATRGAYTGATREKLGLFEHADGGTLFLDEIGETPSDVQPMLLRVLETGEFLPVGGVRPRPVDVRVVAATDARLGAAITAGQFRAPLLHRLAGYEIQLPPLAARREDLGLLLRHFLDDATSSLDASPLDAEGSSWPPASVVARLARHDWPGNVRELRNVAHWLAITGRGCRAHELAARLDERLASVSTDEEPVSTSPIERPSIERPSIERTSPPKRRRLRKPEEIDLDELRQALVDHRYEIRATARALGVSRANLYRLIDSQPSIRKAAALDREEIDDALARHADDLGRAAMDLGVSLRGLKLRLTTLAASEREDA